MKDRRILIVDDEEMSLFLLEMILVDEGFSRIDKAIDGGEALELFEDANLADPYDAIFLDIQLPDMNGLDVLKHIRTIDDEFDCRTTVIMATGDSSLATIQKSIMDFDADDYISKPYCRDEIHEVLVKNAVL